MARPRRETRVEARTRRATVDDPATVLDAAARLLEARPRSSDEVRRRLRAAGYRSELVEAAVARLTDLGYLDDENFARAWVESRDRARPRGERALRDELRRKGIADEVIAALLDDRVISPATALGASLDPGVAGGADDVAAERLLARRGAALLREPDLRKRRAKAYALLARNGFDPDVCGRAAAAWLAEAGGRREREGDAEA